MKLKLSKSFIKSWYEFYTQLCEWYPEGVLLHKTAGMMINDNDKWFIVIICQYYGMLLIWAAQTFHSISTATDIHSATTVIGTLRNRL